MTNKINYELTEEGLIKLKDELHELKNVKRVENLEDIKEARAQGDLSENADYDAARNEQAKIEARIKEIETIIKNVKIIKNSKGNACNIGDELTIYFMNKKVTKVIKLVGTIEANPANNMISVESPLGKGIRNRIKGDICTINTETGKSFDVRIDDIKNGTR